jgi:hypothetical protein
MQFASDRLEYRPLYERTTVHKSPILYGLAVCDDSLQCEKEGTITYLSSTCVHGLKTNAYSACEAGLLSLLV